MDILEKIIGIAFLVGAGYLLGYLQKQQDEYHRGYFFGKSAGIREEQELQKKKTSNKSYNNETIS